MDIVWRSVVQFLLHGRSLVLRGATDKESKKVLIHDEASPLSRSALRVWRKLSARPPSPASLARLDTAVSNRSTTEIQQLFVPALHCAVVRIRLVSQEANAGQSIRILWNSAVHNTNAPSGCIQAARADFAFGVSIVLTVADSVLPWINNIFLYFPSALQEDSSLWCLMARQVQTASNLSSCTQGGATPSRGAAGLDCTPKTRRQDESFQSLASPGTDADASGMSPAMVVYDATAADSEKIPCVACGQPFSVALLTFAEKCGHPLCFSCGTACARMHVEALNSTRFNMPCPAECCQECLSDAELRCLLSDDDFEVCELNEVFTALEMRGAVCPNCSCIFERIPPQQQQQDDLKFRLVCRVCETTFCTKCGLSPFHAGKPCRAMGSMPLCRYCGAEATTREPCDTCCSEECLAKAAQCCTVRKKCGHLCHGTAKEPQCVRCLHEGCPDSHPTQCEMDLCVICYVDSLAEAPCLELQCGHVFHTECLKSKLQKKWPTPRITFNFMGCSICGDQIRHPLLGDLLAPLLTLQASLEVRYMDRLRIQGLLKSPALLDPNSMFYRSPLAFARANLTYYECARCHRAYFGGLKQCEDGMAEEVDRRDLICGGCATTGASSCEKHSGHYTEYKCKYCCNIAVWFCWGTTHFCELCHNPPRKSVRVECPGEERCPLKGKHPPNGTEFAIGCSMCHALSAT